MKLLQLNVWMGRLTRQILPLIEREQPDIITCQEMFSADIDVPFPDQMFDIFERITKTGGYAHTYFSPICDFEYSGVTVGVGNSIHSTLPIVSQSTLFTNGSFQPNADSSVFEANVRNAQFVTLELPDGKHMTLINHHGYWQPNPVGSEQSVTSMRVISDELTHIDNPVILAGDLNVDPGTPPMRLFDGRLIDLTGTHHITNTMSTLGKLQGVAPDHIFVSKDVQVKDFRVLEDLVSDHQALVLEFEL